MSLLTILLWNTNGKDGFSQMHKMWAIGPRNKINVQDKKIHNPVTNYYYNVMNIGSTVYSYLLLKLHSRCSSGTRYSRWGWVVSISRNFWKAPSLPFPKSASSSFSHPLICPSSFVTHSIFCFCLGEISFFSKKWGRRSHILACNVDVR